MESPCHDNWETGRGAAGSLVKLHNLHEIPAADSAMRALIAVRARHDDAPALEGASWQLFHLAEEMRLAMGI